jgi:magnesium chelatase subunit D
VSAPPSPGPPPARTFPFSAVVGQDDARLALLLAAIDPGIGGVLLRGDKGSAKSTLARGLAALLPAGAPFVELPIGATEDRVVGGLDVGAALGGGAARLRPGLLAAAHGGVLYVDEVNLLPDHLVDVILDAAASGSHRVERDGVSHEHAARFVLVGSMNPEEGELRPQLLDRFGLSVDVRAPIDPALRAEVVRRRLAFDAGEPAAAVGDDATLAARLAAARRARLADPVVEFAARLALSVGAEGLRADLVLCRAAAALAGWEGREEATVEDVERVAPMALAHRRRRRPFDPPSLPPDELAEALAQARADVHPDDPPSTSDDVDGRWSDLAADALSRTAAPVSVDAPGVRAAPKETGPTVRGVVVGDRAPGTDGPRAVAVAATLRSTVARGGTSVLAEDVREPVRRRARSRCVILAVDTSGSMGTRQRAEAAAGAVLGLLADAYRSRHRVALVTFRGTGAEVVLAPTASVEVARARLADLPTGGATPLAEGLAAALETAHRVARAGDEPFLVVLTDGRATAGADALERALRAAEEVARAGIRAAVLDAEDGPARLGCAERVAAALEAPCLDLRQVSAAAVEGAIRELLASAVPS